MRTLVALALFLLSLGAGPAAAQARRTLNEYLTQNIGADEGFTPEEREALLRAVRERFAAYGNDIVSGSREAGARVVMRMIIEGHFDEAPVERMAEVGFAAYQAIARGAPADVAEGIALYGYRKSLSGERISLWANGYNQMTQGGVPPEVAADLVRNAMEQGWDDSAFNTFKWALVEAAKEKFNVRDYAVYLFGNMLRKKQGPGQLKAAAHSYFKKLAKSKQQPELPPYDGVFSRMPVPEALYEARPKASPAIAPAKPAAPEPVKPPSPEKIATPGILKPLPPAPPAVKQAPPPLPPEPAPKDFGLSMPILWPGLERSAVGYLGTPYVWGGATRRGIDCSALTQNSYGENRVRIPRVSKDQYKAGDDVYGDLMEGDLVFFNTMGVGVSHVGMVVSRAPRKFIHASSSRGVVIDELDKRYYKARYLGARRIVQ